MCKHLEDDVNFELIIVGSGPEKEKLCLLKKELSLSNIIFPGAKDQQELAEFYKAADLFVYPSNFEPFGAVIPEAMAYGLPIITTDGVGSGHDFVEDGNNGFIVAAADLNAIVNVVRKAMNDKELLTKMSVQSRRKMTRFSNEGNREIVMDAIRHALHQK